MVVYLRGLAEGIDWCYRSAGRRSVGLGFGTPDAKLAVWQATTSTATLPVWTSRGGARLNNLRRDVLAVVPDAQECLSYGVPGFKVQGETVAGFTAFTNHLSYLPHSGSVLAALADELAGHEGTKSSLHFAVDQPLPSGLVRKLITTRMRESGMS